MQRNLFSVERDPCWTALDCNVKHIYRQPPKFRKAIRRSAKRRQDRIIAEWINEIIEEMRRE